MTEFGGFADAVLTSPLGVTWLAVLEAGGFSEHGWQRTSAVAEQSSVSAAVDRVAEMTFGSLVEAAVYASVFESGPWIGDAPAKIAAGYSQAERRAPIVEAIVERFADQLHASLDIDRQDWFCDGLRIDLLRPFFESLDETYAAGELPLSGLWTASDPPPEAIVEMIGAWEYEDGPVTRWRLPVQPEARVVEIHRPTDWAQLVMAHPKSAADCPGWELPGVNQHSSEISPLLRAKGQNAARGQIRHHMVPDWQLVADRFDGIHLSWAGFITSEGCIVDLGDGDVVMLRYWFSERTVWLADVFGQPESTPDPRINLAAGSHNRTRPLPTKASHELIARLLGRRPAQ